MKRHQQHIPLTTSRSLRSARRRVAVLAAVWALSALWSVGHLIAHELEHESHHADVEVEVEGSVVSVDASHGHGHLHPNSLPVVSTGKSPTFETTALPSSVPEIECESSPLRWCTRAEPARASPRLAAASGPRAPPIS